MLIPSLAHKGLSSPTSLLNYRTNIPSLPLESQNEQIMLNLRGEKEERNNEFHCRETCNFSERFYPT